MPQIPLAASPHLGVDVGKESLVIAIAVDGEPPATWPVHEIRYRDDDWHERLTALLAPQAIVVVEPAGINLITPMAQVIAARSSARLMLINHDTTGNIRNQHVSHEKSDAMDARALALVASWAAGGNPPRSLRPYRHDAEEATTALRLHIDSRKRLIKSRTACLNRLEAIAFGIWPALARSRSTWLNCVAAGAVTPAQVKHIATHKPEGMHGNRHHYIRRLAARLPDDIEPHPHTVIAVYQIHKELQAIEPELASNAQAITALIEDPPYDLLTALWRSVPASNDLTIAALHAATRGRAQTYSREAFKSALGTNPQGKSSGRSRSAFQSRRGYSEAARLIHLWTMKLIMKQYRPNPVHDYFARTSSKHKLAAARNKLARILWGIAHHGTPCNWPVLAAAKPSVPTAADHRGDHHD